MKIGLDLDGVVYPWHYAIFKFFVETKNFSGTEREFWDYFRSLSPEAQDYYVLLPDAYNSVIPSRCVNSALYALANLGKIFYITSRHESLIPITRKFFNYFDAPFKENLIFEKDKATICRLLGIDYFLDDLPKNVSSMNGITKAYLMACPHNVHDRDGFKVVTSLREFYDVISGSGDYECFSQKTELERS